MKLEKAASGLRRLLLIEQVKENIEEFKNFYTTFCLYYTVLRDKNEFIDVLKTDCIDDSLLIQVINNAELLKDLGFNPTSLACYAIFYGEDPFKLYTFDGVEDDLGYYPFESIIKNREFLSIKSILEYVANAYNVESNNLYSLFQVLDLSNESARDICKQIRFTLAAKDSYDSLPYLD